MENLLDANLKEQHMSPDFGSGDRQNFQQLIQPNNFEAQTASMTANGILPQFSVERVSDNGGGSNLWSDIKEGAGSVVKEVKNGAEVLKNVPFQDYKDLAVSAGKLVQKEGTGLVLDGIVIAKTKGTNVLADTKLVVDIIQAGTTPEARQVANDATKAWKDGSKALEQKKN